MLLNENLDVIQVIPVLADDYEIEDLGIAKAYGLDVLIKVMGEALPEELMDTLQNVQIACLEEKSVGHMLLLQQRPLLRQVRELHQSLFLIVHY